MDGATYLSNEDLQMGRTVEKEWTKALDRLRTASKEGVRRKVIQFHRKGGHHGDEDESLCDRLQWSLDNLVDHPSLKDCLSYLAAYPEDFPIPVEELLRMWVAEGLCREEDEGVELLGILLAKSVVELAIDGKTCKIHDVMRDLLRLNMKYDAETVIPASERMCLYEPVVNISEFPDEWTGFGVLSARRLSMRNNPLGELPEQFNAPNMVVLMLAETRLTSLRQTFFNTLSNLRVLDLSRTDVQKASGSVLKNLKSLVFLDLRRCWMLREISDGLNSLKELQILLLSGTDLSRLPRMKALTKLHTLSLTVPLRIDYKTLTNDVKHALFRYRTSEVFQSRGLRQLRRLDISGPDDSPLPDDLPLVASQYGREISFLSALEDLTLRDFAKLDYPEGLLNLSCLKILRMVDIREVNNMPALAELPLLEELTIVYTGLTYHIFKTFYKNSIDFPESFGCSGGFPSLKKFKVDRYRCRKMFTFQVGTMPKIEVLHFRFLDDRLEEFPIPLATLPTLKSLYLDLHFVHQRESDAVFSQPNCFPNLERLIFSQNVVSRVTVPKLPSHLLERQEQGKLKVEIFSEY